MKVTEHVQHLLRQGRKPKELIELGFPKRVVTRVRRQLRKEEALQQVKAPKSRGRAKRNPQPPVASGENTVIMGQKLASIKSYLNELKSRVELLEAEAAESVSLEDIEERINGTPALGLKNRFECECGASGLVALHIQCTKCGRETWWGWFPK